MKNEILEAIGNHYCHLLPAIIGFCINDIDDIKEVQSFITALTELVQEGAVTYEPIGNSRYGRFDIKKRSINI